MNLESLKKLCEEATSGPWLVEEPHSYTFDVPKIRTENGGILGGTTHHGKMREDAAFIAASRTAMPQLLRIVRVALTEHKPHCGHCALCNELAALETT